MSTTAGSGAHISGLATMTGQVSFMKFRSQLLTEQHQLHIQMLELVENSKIDGADMYLTLHKPRSSAKQVGNWRLRWRIRHGGEYKHVLWSDLSHALGQLPGPVIRHFEKLNRRVEEVNTIDIVIQQSIKWCELHLGLRDASSVPGAGHQQKRS